MCFDGAAVGEAYDACRAANFDGADVTCADQFCTELDRLTAGPLRQLRAGDAIRETEVILDTRTLTGLPTCGRTLDHHGAQTF